MLTDDKSKESQFAGDRGSIESKIIKLKTKTKIEFEHLHVKTKNGNEDVIINKGLMMAL